MAQKPLSQQMRFDPWNNALVWIMVNPPDGTWTKGYVKRRIQKELGLVAEFSVEITVEGKKKVVEITTVSNDKYNLEYEWVKRCDKDLVHSAAQTKDLTSLSYLNEPEILESLYTRFFNKQIYTCTGPILIAMNPFELFPIYSPGTMEEYRRAGSAGIQQTMPPHAFQIADVAYHKMFVEKFDSDTRENQVILVNGESGAGKTESTKHILRYLSTLSHHVSTSLQFESVSNDIENQIVDSNPIMESFGNAKTLRNNNSSRFGKFIELMYAEEGFIEGAVIRTYLLETVRIVRQSHGERNYHIFYELHAGLPKQLKVRWGLDGLEYFRYTNQSGEMKRRDNESDEDNYKQLRRAMSTLNIENNIQEGVLQMVAGIMHLGNISFIESSAVGEDSAQFSEESDDAVDFVNQLLGIHSKNLLNAIGRRSVVIAGNNILKTLNVAEAEYARDNFAKTIYELVFKWIVGKINTALQGRTEESPASLIGVLDIFGFEFFKQNSFEQLCINYTNEKLQDHFNFAIFKSEQEIYLKEGLNWTFVDYPDNSARLDLLENKSYGIFAQINEQLKLPKSSDERLANTLYQKCLSSEFFTATKAEQVRGEFTIKHFACSVTYQSTGLLDKNRSDISKELSDCLQSSSNDLLKSMALSDVTMRRRSGGGSGIKNSLNPNAVVSGSKKSTTVASQLSSQLNELMTKIRSMRSHFIRCIKPNGELKPRILDKQMTMSQLRCGGVLGAVKVFQAGFPNRIAFEVFVAKYSSFNIVSGFNPLTKGLINAIEEARTTGDYKKYRFAAARILETIRMCDMILGLIEGPAHVPTDVNITLGMQMGRTVVFMRAAVYNYLGQLHQKIYDLAAHRIQIFWKVRRIVKKSKVCRSRAGRVACQIAMRKFADHKRLYAIRVTVATILIQRRARVLLFVLRKRKLIRMCIRLQTWIRKCLAMLWLKRTKNMFVRRIQTLWHVYKYRQLRRTLNTVVVVIQATYRGFITRLRLYRQHRMVFGIIRLQAYIRMFLVQRRAGKRRAQMARRKKFESTNSSRDLDGPIAAGVDSRAEALHHLRTQQSVSMVEIAESYTKQKDPKDGSPWRSKDKHKYNGVEGPGARLRGSNGSNRRSAGLFHAEKTDRNQVDVDSYEDGDTEMDSPGNRPSRRRSNDRKGSMPTGLSLGTRHSSGNQEQLEDDEDDNDDDNEEEEEDQAFLATTNLRQNIIDSRRTKKVVTSTESDEVASRYAKELALFQVQMKTLEQKVIELEEEKQKLHAQISTSTATTTTSHTVTSTSSKDVYDMDESSSARSSRSTSPMNATYVQQSGAASRPHHTHHSSVSTKSVSSTSSSRHHRADHTDGSIADDRTFITRSESSDGSDLSGPSTESFDIDRKRIADLLESVERLQKENINLKNMLEEESHSNKPSANRTAHTRHTTTGANPAAGVTQQTSSQWVKKFSDKHKKHYWKNKIDGRTSWTLPTEDTSSLTKQENTVPLPIPPINRSPQTPIVSGGMKVVVATESEEKPLQPPHPLVGILRKGSSKGGMATNDEGETPTNPNRIHFRRQMSGTPERDIHDRLNVLKAEKEITSIKAAMTSVRSPRDKLLSGWPVTKHGKFHFPKPRLLLVDQREGTLQWRKFSEGSPITALDGEVPLIAISRVIKGKQSSILGKLRGVEESKCLSIHVSNTQQTLDLELPSEEDRDALSIALLQILKSVA